MHNGQTYDINKTMNKLPVTVHAFVFIIKYSGKLIPIVVFLIFIVAYELYQGIKRKTTLHFSLYFVTLVCTVSDVHDNAICFCCKVF